MATGATCAISQYPVLTGFLFDKTSRRKDIQKKIYDAKYQMFFIKQEINDIANSIPAVIKQFLTTFLTF
jgi:hypothetical protein